MPSLSHSHVHVLPYSQNLILILRMNSAVAKALLMALFEIRGTFSVKRTVGCLWGWANSHQTARVAALLWDHEVLRSMRW